MTRGEPEAGQGRDGMIRSRRFVWTCAGRTIPLALDETGVGPTILLLPALSSISTRQEMHRLMRELAPYFHLVALDWPGFGDGAKPKLDWHPDMLSDYLGFVLREVVPNPFAIVATGHGATYALAHLARHPNVTQRLVSVEPTWRGPFPTMMGEYKGWFAAIRHIMDAPGIGNLLYALNLSRPVIDRMVRRHVYSDPAWPSDDDFAAKLAVTRAPGARYASVRFVTGALDRVRSRSEFLAHARKVEIPHLLVYGEETPRRSQAEMAALGALPGVETVLFRKGRLSLHEEFAWKVGFAILTFLLPHRPATDGAHVKQAETAT